MLILSIETHRTSIQLYRFVLDRLYNDLRNLSKLLQDVCNDYPFLEEQDPADSIACRLEDVKMYGNASEAQAASYDRNHARYPYKSHGQWLKGAYGMVLCTVLLLFNGIGAFLERPFDVRKFIASYISVSTSLLLSA